MPIKAKHVSPCQNWLNKNYSQFCPPNQSFAIDVPLVDRSSSHQKEETNQGGFLTAITTVTHSDLFLHVHECETCVPYSPKPLQSFGVQLTGQIRGTQVIVPSKRSACFPLRGGDIQGGDTATGQWCIPTYFYTFVNAKRASLTHRKQQSTVSN